MGIMDLTHLWKQPNINNDKIPKQTSSIYVFEHILELVTQLTEINPQNSLVQNSPFRFLIWCGVFKGNAWFDFFFFYHEYVGSDSEILSFCID